MSHWAASQKVAASFTMVSLEFFFDVILPAALWQCSNRNISGGLKATGSYG